MKLGVRDYFTAISLFGLILFYDGFRLLYRTPSYELMGGVEVVLGVFVVLWGLILLRFSASQRPGLIDDLLDRLIKNALAK